MRPAREGSERVAHALLRSTGAASPESCVVGSHVMLVCAGCRSCALCTRSNCGSALYNTMYDIGAAV